MGDRYVLRESGRDETVGGGEVLDVAPMLPASKARPDHDIDRVIAERGWVSVDDLVALTGERRDATIGRWVVAPGVVDGVAAQLKDRVGAAGDMGLDIATLDDHERAVLATLDDLHVDAGRAHPATAKDTLADHPAIAALQAGGVAPAEPTGFDRAQLRELVRRGVLVERDGLYFHRDAVDHAAHIAAQLLAAHPDGFTVSQFREALGNTRKHAMPLAAELDARGVTRRRGDMRIGGPRLPAP